MNDTGTGAMALLFLLLLIVDIALWVTAYLYSRFVFDSYLKKHHRDKWNELSSHQGFAGAKLFSFDRTPQMRTFRMTSRETLGDGRLQKLRMNSIRLFKSAIILWCFLISAFLIFALVSKTMN